MYYPKWLLKLFLEHHHTTDIVAIRNNNFLKINDWFIYIFAILTVVELLMTQTNRNLQQTALVLLLSLIDVW